MALPKLRMVAVLLATLLGATAILFYFRSRDESDEEVARARRELASGRMRRARQPEAAASLRAKYSNAEAMAVLPGRPRRQPLLSLVADDGAPADDDVRRLDDDSRGEFLAPTLSETNSMLRMTRDSMRFVLVDCWEEVGLEHGTGFLEIELQVYSSPEEGTWVQEVVQTPGRDDEWARHLVEKICMNEDAETCETFSSAPARVFPLEHPVSSCVAGKVQDLVFDPLDDRQKVFLRHRISKYWSSDVLDPIAEKLRG